MATHGLSGTPEFFAWTEAIYRCTNPGHPSYPQYGARGISVCKRWRDSFTAFLADVGARPSANHSLDRIDNNGDYEPGNVRWATRTQQQRNKRGAVLVTHNGQTRHICEWAELFGISFQSLKSRLRRGWTFEAAITTPIEKRYSHQKRRKTPA